MRKSICLIAALLLCVSLTCTAFAAEDIFVPSISYKDGPDIEEAEQDGEDVGDCLVITSIIAAREKTTDIYQEDRDLLLEVYEQLSDGTMVLPLEDDYVIRELVDVSFKKTQCVEPEHGHKEELAKPGTTITITFDLGIPSGTDIIVMTYIDGEWIPAEDVVDNGDGTVTCVFEDICPVVFCVEESENPLLPKTGDQAGRMLPFWIAVMVLSLGAIVTLVLNRFKKHRKHRTHRH